MATRFHLLDLPDEIIAHIGRLLPDRLGLPTTALNKRLYCIFADPVNIALRILFDNTLSSFKGEAIRDQNVFEHLCRLVDIGAPQAGDLLGVAALDDRPSAARCLLERATRAGFMHENRDIALKVSSELGHVEVVRALLDFGADVHFLDIRGSLSRTIMYGHPGHVEVVHLLLLHGANVHLENGQALWVAAGHCKNEEVLRVLLKHGADPNAGEGKALIMAATLGKSTAVKILIENGFDMQRYGGHALAAACYSGHLDVIRMLLESGADVSCHDDRPIIFACERQMPEVVETLIRYGANVRARDDMCIILAAQCGNVDICRLLLANGADCRSQGNKALLMAARCGHLEVVSLLLDAGANPSVREGEGSALLNAVKWRHFEVVKLLLDRGSGVYRGSLSAAVKVRQMSILEIMLEQQVTTEELDNALVIAAECGHLNALELLLDARRSNCTLNREPDVMAFSKAAWNGHLDIVQFFLDHGMNIHAPAGTDAFIASAERKRVPIVNLFLDHGLNIHAENERALREAAEKGKFRLVKFLLKKGARIDGPDGVILEAAKKSRSRKVLKLGKERIRRQVKRGEWPPHSSSK